MIDVIIIDANMACLRREAHQSVAAALESVGLRIAESNRGPLRPGLYVALHVWALTGDPTTYYAIDRQLLNGPAVLFAMDGEGHEVSLPRPLSLRVTWFGSVADVEAAIAAGKLQRSQRSVGGVVTWAWDGREMTSEEARDYAQRVNAAAVERLGNEEKL